MEGISVRLHVSLPKPFNPSEWQLEPDVTDGHNCRALLSSQSNSCDIWGYDAGEYEDQGFWDVTSTLKVAEQAPTKGWSSRNYKTSHSRRPKYTKIISTLYECQFEIYFERFSWARASSKVHDQRSNTPHSVGLLYTSDQPFGGTSTWQHSTLTTDRHPCPPRDWSPQSQQASGRRPTQTARPPGSAFGYIRQPKNI
jgi:hypothetical protein